MEMKCKKCGFKYVSAPDRYCVNCGYHFDYIEREDTLDIQTMKQMPNLLYIRTGMCAICEKGETRKGLHAYVSITNKGVLIEVFEKFQYGFFANKKWRFKENPRILLPYDQLEIIRGDYDGKQVCYYCYKTPQAGELRLNFNADGSISSKFNLNEEMKILAEKFMSL